MASLISQLTQVFRRLGRAPLFAAVILITVASRGTVLFGL
jgi:hypothetical protein